MNTTLNNPYLAPKFEQLQIDITNQISTIKIASRELSEDILENLHTFLRDMYIYQFKKCAYSMEDFNSYDKQDILLSRPSELRIYIRKILDQIFIKTTFSTEIQRSIDINKKLSTIIDHLKLPTLSTQEIISGNYHRMREQLQRIKEIPYQKLVDTYNHKYNKPE